MECIANALFPFLRFEGEEAEIEKNGHFQFTIGNSVARGKHARSVKVEQNDQYLNQ